MTAATDAPLVVFTDITDLDPRPAERLLVEAGFRTLRLALPAEPVPVAAADAVAAIVGYARLGAAEFDAMPSLRMLATTSVGTDMIDSQAARARGITVRTLAGVATEEVAAHALALILAVERGLVPATAVVAAGGWTDDLTWVPRRLGTLTLGLVGLGRIGGALARMAAPLFGRIIACDPWTSDAGPVDLVGFERLLAESDIVSLHTPLTDDTRGMISTDRLASMRPGCVLVNVSRGELVDAAAVQEALASGRLRGYAADVLTGEPPAADDPLRTLPGALVTPHSAFLSDASLRGYQEQPARNVIAALAKVSHG